MPRLKTILWRTTLGIRTVGLSVSLGLADILSAPLIGLVLQTLKGRISMLTIASLRLRVKCKEGLVKFSQRLRWSRGSVLAFGTQVRGFKPGQSRRIFKGK